MGTGAYVSVGLSANIAGSLLVWAIIIAAFTAFCNGLSSAQLAAAHPVSGGTYEYGYHFLTPLSGRIATMGEEITEPRRNIPRAVVLTLAVVSAIYIAVGLAILHLGGIASFEQSHFNIANLISDPNWRWLVVLAALA